MAFSNNKAIKNLLHTLETSYLIFFLCQVLNLVNIYTHFKVCLGVRKYIIIEIDTINNGYKPSNRLYCITCIYIKNDSAFIYIKLYNIEITLDT